MDTTKLKVGYILGMISAIVAIVIPILVLSYSVGRMSKQIDINTVFLQTLALKETVNSLKADNDLLIYPYKIRYRRWMER